MINLRLLTIITVLFCGTTLLAADEKTDVTAQYITNASFEADNLSALSSVNNSADGLRGYSVKAPSGWTVSNTANAVSLIVTKDCYTDNNFGKVTTLADGAQAYYLRMGWSTGSTVVSQTLKGLPKGKYQLEAAIRSAYVNQAASTLDISVAASKSTIGFVQGSTGCFTSMPWTVEKLFFEQATDGDATIKFTVNWQSGGSCIMIDNFHLYRLADDFIAPQQPTEADVESPTEGVVTGDFVAESTMQADLMQMLANFATYMKNDFQDCVAPNSEGEVCGCFRGENTMGNDEKGVRPNADLSMICAFLVKYGKPAVTLPTGVTWEDLEAMAMKSLIFAYSTHKANKLKVTAGNKYWGSTSTNDAVWESSLWAMSVAYSAFFQWDKLTDKQRNYIYQLLKTECNYELGRSIPTGYNGDTKAEENGWEADVLAATLGLFPNDPLAPQWFQRLREFAINSYSQKDDATDQTVIDPDYDQQTVAQLYKGKNLYDDFTLQNHNYFHTSYQNVVIQELGEAALALKLFQQGLYGTEKWKTNALMHNNQKVMDEVLYWLALADGELAMPNGNDWSLFLYDQITSYSTNACFLRDPHALMLENLAYKMIKARQTTTADGSWLLRADVGARRMGVEAHRVMMTWLMHHVLPTEQPTAAHQQQAPLSPTRWEAFNRLYGTAKLFESQNIIRAATDSRFTCFSWSKGLQSYTGYIAANSVDKNKIIVPFRQNNTGNFLGWYEVQGKNTNATPVNLQSIPANAPTRSLSMFNVQTEGNAWVMNGELQTNDKALNHRFAIYSTPGNAVVYVDQVRANTPCTITAEKGGLMAISVDELTKTSRTLYTAAGHQHTDGSMFTTLTGQWLNVDNALGIVVAADSQNDSPASMPDLAPRRFAFGERANNNSIMTAKLYASYNDQRRAVEQGEEVASRAITYYSNITAEETAGLSSLSSRVSTPDGWNGVIVADPDSTRYLLLSNFNGGDECMLTLTTPSYQSQNSALDLQPSPNLKPVFNVLTTISATGASATFTAKANTSVANTLHFFIDGRGVEAVQAEGAPTVIYLRNLIKGNNTLTVTAYDGGVRLTKTIKLSTKILRLTIRGGELLVEEAAGFPGDVIPGDLNDDCLLDLRDMECLSGLIAAGSYEAKGDLNNDGHLDIGDFILMILQTAD